MKLVIIFSQLSNISFLQSCIINSWCKTYATFISKKSHPKIVFDDRYVALTNVCYKILSKLLAHRLKTVLPSFIGSEQCGFVLGRNALNNIITLQEVVHTINRDRTSPRMVVKIDIEKDFDSIS